MADHVDHSGQGDATGRTDETRPVIAGVQPDPTPEELAAIMAAVEVATPRAAVAAAPEPPPRWRFSGRWWTKPIPARRARPF